MAKKELSMVRWIVLISSMIMIGFNGIAQSVRLGGVTVAEVSDSYSVFFVPAGYVFSIWGLIYLLLLMYSVYQLLPSQRDDEWYNGVAFWVIFGNVANIAWIYLWHMRLIPWTVLAMVALLFSLVMMSQDIWERIQKLHTRQFLAFVRLPFSVYLGWICVATIANVTVYLTDIGWNGFGIDPKTWGMIMIATSAALGITLTLLRRDAAAGLVFVWALSGIGVKFSADTQYMLFAFGASLLVVLSVLISFFAPKVRPQSKKSTT